MKAITLAPKIAEAVKEYLDNEEGWGDDAVLAIDPATEQVKLEETEPDDAETSAVTYVRVMDLVRMSVEDPGQWLIDPVAVADLAADLAD